MTGYPLKLFDDLLWLEIRPKGKGYESPNRFCLAGCAAASLPYIGEDLKRPAILIFISRYIKVPATCLHQPRCSLYNRWALFRNNPATYIVGGPVLGLLFIREDLLFPRSVPIHRNPFTAQLIGQQVNLFHFLRRRRMGKVHRL